MAQQEIDERVLFTPLCGVHSEDPLCYLLQIDNTRVLLDCGWNEKFEPELLEPLRDVFPTVDLILISFPDLEHMGALAYAVKHFGLKGPQTQIYATTPTKYIGLQYLYEAYLSRAQQEPFDLFDLDDIDLLETRIVEKKYNQRFLVRGMSVTDIEIYAHPSGRMLGGAMWKLVRDPDEILYAVDFNHAKDNLLEGISKTCEKYKLKPTLMITDSYNWMNSSRSSMAKRKDDICNMILGVLRRSRSCLLPIDCGGRVLELLYILNQYWNQQKLTYPIVFLTLVPSVMLYAANNLTEFMNEDQENMFLRTRKNPFENLNKVEVVSDLSKVHEFRDPKVVLACSGTMESGAIKSLLSYYGQRDGHLILFTDRTMLSSSLTRRVLGAVNTHETSFVRHCNIPVEINTSKWVYKTGQELVRWRMQRREMLVAEKRKRQQEEEANALRDDMAMDGMDIYGIGGGDQTEAIPPEAQLDGDRRASMLEPDRRVTMAESSTLDRRVSMLGLDRRASMFMRQSSMMSQMEDAATSGGGLFAEFARQSTANDRMFSLLEPERTKKWDEYGEIVNDEDFMLAEDDETKANEDEDIITDEEMDDDIDDMQMDEDEKPGENDETSKKRKRRRRQYGDPVSDCLLPVESRQHLPRECVRQSKEIVIRCAVGYVDLEGRADGPSYKNIIKMLKPRKVVIVHGTAESSKNMVQSCLEAAIQTAVAPRLGETADVSSDVGMWRIELEAGLFDQMYPLFCVPKTVKAVNSETFGIRYLEGIVSNPTEGDENFSEQAGVANVPVIMPLHLSAEDNTAGAQLTRSVEPQLVHGGVTTSDISKVLRKAGINVEVKTGGFIVCDNSIVVQLAQGTERVMIDGPVGALYYKVRELVYGCYISV